jgi:hypothetical protein
MAGETARYMHNCGGVRKEEAVQITAILPGYETPSSS